MGTRPEGVKCAPLVHELTRHPQLAPVVVSTGQHREMLDEILAVFGVTPHVDLDLLQHGQTLTDLTSRAVAAIGPVLDELAPDAVVVQGDTTTTFCGALAAFYRQIPVVHLEAGLRTGDVYSPFPEEVNRRLTTQLAALHLAPTPANARHLLAEGIAGEDIVVTGNTVIDALRYAVARPTSDPLVARVAGDPRRVVLVTAHRRESWGEPMAAVGRAVARLAERDDVLVVLPAHPNPVVRRALLPSLEGLDNVIVTEPLSYVPFCHLMRAADLILTDSGGVQEEGPSLGTPVLVLRDTSERPEAITAGTARLVGTDEDRIVEEASALLDDELAYELMANAVNPYGDGRAAQRSVAAIAALLGVGRRLDHFDGGGVGSLDRRLLAPTVIDLRDRIAAGER